MGNNAKPLNYTTHAIENLVEEARHLRIRGLQTARFFETTADLLRYSEKFILPENGRLLDIEVLKEHYAELLRLPYPIVTLEFETTKEFGGGSNKAILLCWTGADLIAPDQLSGVVDHCEEAGVICYTSLFWSAQQSSWLPSPFAFWFHRNKVFMIGNHGPTRWAIYSVVAQGLIDPNEYHPDEYDRMVENEMRFGMDVLLEFCLTVNCENVDQDLIPAPKLLNKKREIKNREPFYSYKVLAISQPAPPTSKKNGTHASPRMHLRRGHLRRLSSGRVIWVRHSIIGSQEKGIVEKAYSVQ